MSHLDHDKIKSILGSKSARIGEKKPWYCPKCKVHVQVTTGMYVPRHDCGRQMRPDWKD